MTIFSTVPKASHTVKLSLPASMDAEPVARVAEHFAKSYNEAHPHDEPIKPNRLRLSSDADRRLVDLKSPVGAAVKDGSAYTFSEQDVNDQQAPSQEQTPPPLPPRHLPFPRRCRVVGRGLVLRASPETIADPVGRVPLRGGSGRKGGARARGLLRARALRARGAPAGRRGARRLRRDGPLALRRLGAGTRPRGRRAAVPVVASPPWYRRPIAPLPAAAQAAPSGLRFFLLRCAALVGGGGAKAEWTS